MRPKYRNQKPTYLSIRRSLIVNHAVLGSTEATRPHIARSALFARPAAAKAVTVDANCLYSDD